MRPIIEMLRRELEQTTYLARKRHLLDAIESLEKVCIIDDDDESQHEQGRWPFVMPGN